MDKKIILITLIFIFALLLGGVGGFFIGKNYYLKSISKTSVSYRPLRESNSGYKFIDPLLAYIIPSADSQGQLVGLKSDIKKIVDNKKSTGVITDASVFFYDMNGGRWIGVNEQDQYTPASMLKVVIMVAYIRQAEDKPEVLKERLNYSQELDNLLKQDKFNSSSNLQISNDYSVQELINKMIIDSDNGAEFLLLTYIDHDYLDNLYNALNIEPPNPTSGDFVISPRRYSLFFRILYNGTYLTKEDSEKALEVLSKTTFKDGIVAGLPDNLSVAHKFGERVVAQNNQIQSIELHDCGIVYYPKNPYFLCVMTRGNNLENLQNTIKDISSAVYKSY